MVKKKKQKKTGPVTLEKSTCKVEKQSHKITSNITISSFNQRVTIKKNFPPLPPSNQNTTLVLPCPDSCHMVRINIIHVWGVPAFFSSLSLYKFTFFLVLAQALVLNFRFFTNLSFLDIADFTEGRTLDIYINGVYSSQGLLLSFFLQYVDIQMYYRNERLTCLHFHILEYCVESIVTEGLETCSAGQSFSLRICNLNGRHSQTVQKERFPL